MLYTLGPYSELRPLVGMEMGIGILSMSADDVPYGVPLSFGYDGDSRLFFLFVGTTTDLRQETYADQSDVASLTTYDVGSDGSWRSVVVSGPIDRVTPDEWDAARDAMTDNAYQSTLLAEHDLQENPNVWVLKVAERSGRAVGQ
ncbi:pyridoxamine 5'-phosphate oxidase family protein [Halorubrum sp. N11]|uniref:pyridoxamine 5'-phosphate oxidase family protein n=1 Tax=Halorubrum sp. N11 TaxID=3402276 RepID=UPI003EB6A7E8